MPHSRSHARAPISGPRITWWSRSARAADLLGHFLVGAVPGFLGGLATGNVGIAALIGLATGLAWALLNIRFGNRMDSSMNLSPEQVTLRARARANGYMGPGFG